MAGAYINEVAISFAKYLHLYKSSFRLSLLQTSSDMGPYRDQRLYPTLLLSFQRIKQQSKLSAQLLQLWTYFDKQDLWLGLLQGCSSPGPEWFTQLTMNHLTFKRAMIVLLDHSLVEPEKFSEESEIESTGYSMHSVIHLGIVHLLNTKWDVELAGLALDCVASHVPDKNSPNSWAIQRRLIPHAARCCSFVNSGLFEGNGRVWALHCLGYLYEQQGKHSDAEELYQRALQGKEEEWGRDHPSTLETANNLGHLYADLGRFNEAEKLYQRALRGYEKAWGPEHTSALDTVNNLGHLYADLERFNEAEKLYQRALQGYERAWGLEHTSTLDTVNNLGVLYWKQGKLDEAEEMTLRALYGKEKAWGREHISTFDTVENLGNVYKNQGKLDKAEKMYLRALQGYEKALGLDQVQAFIPALNAMQDFAAFYEQLGRINEAKGMYSRVLDGLEAVLGLSSNRYKEVLTVLEALEALDSTDDGITNPSESTP